MREAQISRVGCFLDLFPKPSHLQLVEQGPGFGNHFWEEIQTQAGLRKNEADPLQKPDPLHTSQPKPDQPAKERKT